MDSSAAGLYGLRIRSDLPLALDLPPAGGETYPDLVIHLCREPPVSLEGASNDSVYESSLSDLQGRSVLRIYRLAGWDLLHFPGVADFYLSDREILCRPVEGGDRRMLEIRFLGTVMAFWLERSGTAALHASAVALGDRAVGLLAASGSGKSSLTLGLLDRGARLLTDDILALDLDDSNLEDRRVSARPSYPALRMWPDLARRYVDDVSSLPKVNDRVEKVWTTPQALGFEFQPSSSPLAAIYLPERLDEERAVEIEAVGPREALAELLRHSFLHRMPAALGWERRRLETLARVVESVPVRRLRYPSGWQYLPAVLDAVEESLGFG
ncbi:MAG: hypothetical protein SX243_04630 [Acidobacteriota bacterium]|nr:hypothetical protein [Acidobacteriota bacterium]